MVNFETDTIVQVSPRVTITLIYLQRSEELMKAWTEYYIVLCENKTPTKALAVIRAATLALFKRLKPSMRKSLSAETFKELEGWVYSDVAELLEKAADEMEDYLYRKNITKIDSTKAYNPARIEEENSAYGV
jgi:hypothetical protein